MSLAGISVHKPGGVHTTLHNHLSPIHVVTPVQGWTFVLDFVLMDFIYPTNKAFLALICAVEAACAMLSGPVLSPCRLSGGEVREIGISASVICLALIDHASRRGRARLCTRQVLRV
jgi:hypothetical protein